MSRRFPKKILVGRRGAMLKGSHAAVSIWAFLPPGFLSMFVRVQKDWTSSKRMIREFGYDQ